MNINDVLNLNNLLTVETQKKYQRKCDLSRYYAVYFIFSFCFNFD